MPSVPQKRLSRRIARQTFDLIDSMNNCREQICSGTDKEALHDYRVGTRRLCSLLLPFERLDAFAGIAKPLKRLRRCLKQSNAVRDMEVQASLVRTCILQPASSAVLGWLDQQSIRQRALAEELLNHLGSAHVRRATRRLKRQLPEVLDHVDVHLLRMAIHAYHTETLHKIDAHLSLGEAVLNNPDQWHALRLDCKKLRYLCEAYGTLLGSTSVNEAVVARKVQDALGELRDVDLLLAELGRTENTMPTLTDSLLNRRIGLQAQARDAVAMLASLLWTPQVSSSSLPN